MKNKNNVINLPKPEIKYQNKKELEEQLFDAHMNTMYDLAIELSERDELTEAEENFLDALDDWNEFLDSEEE